MLKIAWLVAIALGVLLRVLAAYHGYNYDMESYFIVADLMREDVSVYSGTSRYNYGPIWFHIVHYMDILSAWATDRFHGFRINIAIFLTIVDVLIALFIKKRYSTLLGIVFILNPISIVITGYHSQFDSLAILIGVISLLVYERSVQDNDSRIKLFSLILLGVSIATKHVLFLLPFWLMMREKRLPDRLMVAIVPCAVFLVAFVPYWGSGANGIINNVLLYKSTGYGSVWHYLENYLALGIPKIVLYIIILSLLGYILKGADLFTTLWLYLIALVAFSPSLANQYLAIAAVSAAVFGSIPLGIFLLTGGLYLAADANGLGLEIMQSIYLDMNVYRIADTLVVLLISGLVYELVRIRRSRINNTL